MPGLFPDDKWATQARWRTGRRVGRTIYAMLGDRPTDGDPLVGVMDSPALASSAVDAHNTILFLAAAHIGPSSDTPENTPQGQ